MSGMANETGCGRGELGEKAPGTEDLRIALMNSASVMVMVMVPAFGIGRYAQTVYETNRAVGR